MAWISRYLERLAKMEKLQDSVLEELSLLGSEEVHTDKQRAEAPLR